MVAVAREVVRAEAVDAEKDQIVALTGHMRKDTANRLEPAQEADPRLRKISKRVGQTGCWESVWSAGEA